MVEGSSCAQSALVRLLFLGAERKPANPGVNTQSSRPARPAWARFRAHRGAVALETRLARPGVRTAVPCARPAEPRGWLRCPSERDTVASKLTLQALDRVLCSLDALRNGAAIQALLGTFCLAGLMLASSRSALAQEQMAAGWTWMAGALLVTIFGVNLCGLQLMDQAQGRPVRSARDAFYDSLRIAPRLLLCLGVSLGLAAVLGLLVLAVLAAVRIPYLGVLMLTLAMPLGVLVFGGGALLLGTLVGPLTGPALWSGCSGREALGALRRILRHYKLEALLLMGLVMGLSAGVTAALSFMLLTGGRVLALIAPLAADIHVPARQLMASLMGHGLQDLITHGGTVDTGLAGLAVATGGGVVFSIALVLPTLVYLRGCCTVWLSLSELMSREAAP